MEHHAEPSNEKAPESADAAPTSIPFKKTPPQSENAAYEFHGEVIPDPFRPLENIPDFFARKEEKSKHPVQLWINHQMIQTRKLLGTADDNHVAGLELAFAEAKEPLDGFEADAPYFSFVDARKENPKLDSESEFLAWHPHVDGFYYSKLLPDEESKFRKTILFHRPGTAWSIDHVIFRDCSSSDQKFHAHLERYVSDQTVLFTIHNDGKFSRSTEQFLIDPRNPTLLIALPKITSIRLNPYVIGLDESFLYAVFREGIGNYGIRRLPIGGVSWDQAEPILSDLALQKFHHAFFVADRLVCIEAANLESVLRVYSKSGNKIFEFEPEIPSAICYLDHPRGDTVRFKTTSWFQPWAYYSLQVDSLNVTALDRSEPPSWTEDFAVTREFVTSTDGEKIPLTVLHCARQSSPQVAPMILYGYGGFGLCTMPEYNPFDAYWLQSGGSVAYAHLRGDGGWSPDWAEQGSGRFKPRTFEDFVSCAEHLIQTGRATASSLVSMGTSNGGLTVVAAMQKRPDLFGCVISKVPVLDMLNLPMSNCNGSRTVWQDAYGIPEIEEDYKVIRSYSPLQNIKAETAYPPLFLMAAGADNTAHPAHALKFVATMQDLNGAKNCFLYWSENGQHHAFSEFQAANIEVNVDVIRFVLHHFDTKF